MKDVLFLVYGEDGFDREALCNLIHAIIGNRSDVQVMPVKRPIILRRDASSAKRLSMTAEIAGFEMAFRGRARKICVVAHRDCDACEPAHIQEQQDLEVQLKLHDVKYPIAATPAWEMEAWWYLFPAALEKTRKCWSKIAIGSKNVGMIVNAKEALRRDLRPKGKGASKCRDYTEGDAVLISRNVRDDPSLIDKITAQSESFIAFHRAVLKVLHDKQ